MTDVISFWASDCRSWIVVCLDFEGNQIWDAIYFPNKNKLMEAFQ